MASSVTPSNELVEESFPHDSPEPVGTVLPEDESSNGVVAFPPALIDARILDYAFYIEGVFVIFEVEDHLFRVPTYMFARESPFFANQYELPSLKFQEERSDDLPERTIALPSDIRQEDFRNFLKALYPTVISSGALSLSQLDWISVLKLSTKWRFKALRETAITALESLTPLNRISLGLECFVKSWVLSGYSEIVTRQETISNDDAKFMGYPATLELFRLRERRLQGGNWPYFHPPDEVANAFAAELLSLKETEESLFPVCVKKHCKVVNLGTSKKKGKQQLK